MLADPEAGEDTGDEDDGEPHLSPTEHIGDDQHGDGDQRHADGVERRDAGPQHPGVGVLVGDRHRRASHAGDRAGQAGSTTGDQLITSRRSDVEARQRADHRQHDGTPDDDGDRTLPPDDDEERTDQ